MPGLEDDAPPTDGSTAVGPSGGVILGGGRGRVGEKDGPGLTTPDGVLPGVPGPAGAERTGMVNTCPSDSELGSAILFALTMSSTATPIKSATPHRVSLALTEYVVGAMVG